MIFCTQFDVQVVLESFPVVSINTVVGTCIAVVANRWSRAFNVIFLCLAANWFTLALMLSLNIIHQANYFL